MENGFIYSSIIDPILKPLHQEVGKLLNEQETIIDFACGTGALAIYLSQFAKEVIGIDHSPSMIAAAQKKADKANITNTRFMESDILEWEGVNSMKFDKAIISLAIHQFPIQIAHQVIDKMKKLSNSLIFVDYNYPQPRDFYGKFIYLVERIAGKEHFRNFRSYVDYGGIDAYLKHHGLSTSTKIIRARNLFSITLAVNSNS